MPTNWARFAGDLGLYSADVEGLETELKIDAAKRAEEAALATDARIVNSEGGVVRHPRRAATSLPIRAALRASTVRATVRIERQSPVAREGESMERDYWGHCRAPVCRTWNRRRMWAASAAERALRRLNPVKVETQKVPVVFEPRHGAHAAR